MYDERVGQAEINKSVLLSRIRARSLSADLKLAAKVFRKT